MPLPEIFSRPVVTADGFLIDQGLDPADTPERKEGEESPDRVQSPPSPEPVDNEGSFESDEQRMAFFGMLASGKISDRQGKTSQEPVKESHSPEGQKQQLAKDKLHEVVRSALKDEVSEYAKLGIDPGLANSGECATVAREAIKKIRAAGGDANFATPANSLAHVWVESGGRHYDIQHPDGVDHPSKLTFFQDNPDLLESGWKAHKKSPVGDD